MGASLVLVVACSSPTTSPQLERTATRERCGPAQACGPADASAQLEGFWQAGTIALAPAGEVPAWTIQPGGDGIVLVIYRSEGGSSHRSADNEELVVQLSALEAAGGGDIVLERPGRVVRYQRGGRKLTYVSEAVTGRLTLTREADRVRGQVSLTASAPTVNRTGSREDLTRQLAFELERK